MSIAFERITAPSSELVEQLLELWTDVTNVGGAVGFVPPVTRDDVRPTLDEQLAPVRDGRSVLLVGFERERLVAAVWLTFNTMPLMRHWLWLYRVMVHPDCQGKGYGYALMTAAADAARSFDGIEAIRLTCRGGLGLGNFYASCGYKEVGRVPGAIRVGPGDDRDDITMLLTLDRV